MTYGYARVSTRGQNLSVQIAELRNAGAEVIFAEKFTGTRRDRPELTRMLETVREGDRVVVAKLDRIARSVRDGIAVVDELLAKGVTIDILNMGKFDMTPAGKLLRSIMFAFAEFERDMIVERTQEGKEIARERNPEYREGRPGMSAEMEEKIRQGVGWEELGISRKTWYNHGGRRTGTMVQG